ncbi:MAG: butyrate kinase [Ignavibacteriae bacterium]|nr:butyrate kinase [Ignavibacteriota bacterium]
MRILVINPGSTSTKISVFDDLSEVFTKVLRHSSEELSQYPRIIDQYYFRKKIIIEALSDANIDIHSLDAVVGRGGLLKPIPGGVYRVNETLISDLRKELLGEHASNIGGILAREIANENSKKIEAFIVDPVVVDELDDIARISGNPILPRISIFHALNQKAVARRFARENNQKYEDLNLIVVHLGGGITVGVHKQGRVIDVNNGLDGEGPFSPERAGTLPAGALSKLCFSDKYQYHEIRKMITGKGGMVAYLGTNDAAEIEKRSIEGEAKAKLILEAMAYQVAKEIGACSTVLSGKIDCILITGGLAFSNLIINLISERVKFLAPIKVYPGEDEMKALAEGTFYALMGELPIREYN